jgi:hypothetical protein
VSFTQYGGIGCCFGWFLHGAAIRAGQRKSMSKPGHSGDELALAGSCSEPSWRRIARLQIVDELFCTVPGTETTHSDENTSSSIAAVRMVCAMRHRKRRPQIALRSAQMPAVAFAGCLLRFRIRTRSSACCGRWACRGRRRSWRWLVLRRKSGGDWLETCFGAGEGEGSLTRPRHPGSLWGAVCLWVRFRAKCTVRSL